MYIYAGKSERKRFYNLFQVLSKWLIKYPDTIQTGNGVVDSVFTVLLSTTILVGGVLGCLLDNIIPGIINRDNNNGIYAY